jgi:hypothetical protein
VGNPLFAAQAHVYLPLTDATLPRKQAKQGKNGTLEHTFARKTAILLMTTTGTRPHENLDGLDTGGKSSESKGRIT